MFPSEPNQPQEQQNPQQNPQNNQQSNRRSRQAPVKKSRPQYKLTPQEFEQEKGIKALYERTKELKLDENSEINVENTMKKIVVTMKTWQFQMVPKYTFDYFLQRCQALGAQKQLMAYMAKVRKVHKGEQSWPTTENQGAADQPQQPAAQGEGEDYYQHGNMQEEHKQAMDMLNKFQALGNKNKENVELDEDDLELMQMMEKVAKKKKIQENPQEESQEPVPYVPEGFDEFPFSEDEN